jgi:hypothetical protein
VLTATPQLVKPNAHELAEVTAPFLSTATAHYMDVLRQSMRSTLLERVMRFWRATLPQMPMRYYLQIALAGRCGGARQQSNTRARCSPGLMTAFRYASLRRSPASCLASRRRRDEMWRHSPLGTPPELLHEVHDHVESEPCVRSAAASWAPTASSTADPADSVASPTASLIPSAPSLE